jgi:hypothetical protein
MTANIFALYSIDGVTEYKLDRSWPTVYLPPWWATWQQEPVDTLLDGSRVYGLYKAVTWDFGPYARGIAEAQYDLFKNLQTSAGQIRFQTYDQHRRQYVVCTGYIDRIPGGTSGSKQKQRYYGTKINFTRVVEV